MLPGDIEDVEEEVDDSEDDRLSTYELPTEPEVLVGNLEAGNSWCINSIVNLDYENLFCALMCSASSHFC